MKPDLQFPYFLSVDVIYHSFFVKFSVFFSSFHNNFTAVFFSEMQSVEDIGLQFFMLFL